MTREDEFTKLIREFGANENSNVFDGYINREFNRVMQLIKEAKEEDDNEK